MNNTYKQILRGLVKTLSKLKHNLWVKWGKNVLLLLMDRDFDKLKFIADIQPYWVLYDKLNQSIINMYDGYQYKIYKQHLLPAINQLVEIKDRLNRLTIVHFISMMTRIFKLHSQVYNYNGLYFVLILLTDSRMLWKINELLLRLFTLLKVTPVIVMRHLLTNNIKILDLISLYKVMQLNNLNISKLIIPSGGIIRRYM